MTKTTLAWHFAGDKLRDGQPIPEDGVKLVHRGKVIPCRSGLHGSVRLIDALRYAPGSTICRVRLGGTIVPHGNDKLAASERTILWRLNGEALLRAFTRQCALDVTHLWDAPPGVRQFLETGDESLRAAAAAWTAARDAAWTAAWAAAWDAAAPAARAAAWDAARAAAWDAARRKQNRTLTQMVWAARRAS